MFCTGIVPVYKQTSIPNAISHSRSHTIPYSKELQKRPGTWRGWTRENSGYTGLSRSWDTSKRTPWWATFSLHVIRSLNNCIHLQMCIVAIDYLCFPSPSPPHPLSQKTTSNNGHFCLNAFLVHIVCIICILPSPPPPPPWPRLCFSFLQKCICVPPTPLFRNNLDGEKPQRKYTSNVLTINMCWSCNDWCLLKELE